MEVVHVFHAFSHQLLSTVLSLQWIRWKRVLCCRFRRRGYIGTYIYDISGTMYSMPINDTLLYSKSQRSIIFVVVVFHLCKLDLVCSSFVNALHFAVVSNTVIWFLITPCFINVYALFVAPWNWDPRAWTATLSGQNGRIPYFSIFWICAQLARNTSCIEMLKIVPRWWSYWLFGFIGLYYKQHRI